MVLERKRVGVARDDELGFGLGRDRWARGRSRVLCEGEDVGGDVDLLGGRHGLAREVVAIWSLLGGGAEDE